MNELQLVVGTDSTWSIRASLCLQISGLHCHETVINLSDNNKTRLKQHSATMLVPVLIMGELKIHDSLAIAEYINELSSGSLYPESSNERAIARSLCAELHSGFNQLRSTCPFYIDQTSTIIITPELDTELTRIKNIWSSAQGEFMFKNAGAVDAFYAVLAYRLASYGINFDGKAGLYQRALLDWHLFKDVMIKANDWRST